MTRAEIQNKVVEIIVDQLGVSESEVTVEAKFIEDLGADSLDTVELIMAFEDEFDLEVPDEEAEQLSSVIKVIDYLETKLNS
jgi:acyl carrier protein